MKPPTRSLSFSAGDAQPALTRRRLAGLAAGGFGLALLAGCDKPKWHSIDISGSFPPLAFTLTRTQDGNCGRNRVCRPPPMSNACTA